MRDYEVYYDVEEDKLIIYKRDSNINSKIVDTCIGKYGIEFECNIYDNPLKMIIYDATTTLGFTEDMLVSFACDRR